MEISSPQEIIEEPVIALDLVLPTLGWQQVILRKLLGDKLQETATLFKFEKHLKDRVERGVFQKKQLIGWTVSEFVARRAVQQPQPAGREMGKISKTDLDVARELQGLGG